MEITGVEGLFRLFQFSFLGVFWGGSRIQVLGNAISDVLRPSHGVLRSVSFKPKCHSFASKYCKTTLK